MPFKASNGTEEDPSAYRARWRVYLADPSIALSLLVRRRSMLENSDLVGRAVELGV